MITILTPSYNRAHTLTRLYRSLMEQSSHDFEWLIIDDGSTDGTEAQIERYRLQASFPIRYIRKNNGGKHTALNLGFREARREWIFIVDSDDWLSKDCVLFASEEITGLSKDFLSLSFLKSDGEGNIIGEIFPAYLDTYIDRICFGVAGDKADVIRKEALEGFHFPEYKGERFMAESPLFLWLGERGRTRFLNYQWYFCEYQNDGLSNKSLQNRYLAINSTLHVYECQYKDINRFHLRARAAINWWRFRVSQPRLQVKRRLPLVYLPFGFIMFLADRRKIKDVRQ